MSFAHRLRELIDRRSRGNISDFARLCAIRDSSVHQYLDGTKPSFQNLIAIANACGVSLDWLVLGRGSHNSENSAGSEGQQVQLPRLDGTASAGNGAVVNDHWVSETISLPGSLLREIGVDATFARALQASGKSMEPAISDRDLLIVDTSPRRRIAIDGKIYVFSVEDELFVKRLRKTARGWMMVSDNRELYPEEPLPTDRQVTIHGLVVWAGKQL